MPVSDCEVRDPRTRRTRQRLHAALRELLGIRPFDEISVQEIADTAEVNRATFYDHYTDKFALLEALVASGFHRLLEERSVRYDGTCPSAAAALIRATRDYLGMLRVAQGSCEKGRNLEALEDAALVASIRRVLAEGMACETNGRAKAPAEGCEMRSSAAAGAIYGAVKQWQAGGRGGDADEEAMVRRVVEMVRPMLADAAGAPADAAAVRGHGEPAGALRESSR